MISSYKAVGFDMDGTLMNTQVDYMKMANLIFDEMVRLGVPETEIDRSHGSKFNIDTGVAYLAKNGRMNELYEIESRISETARDIEMENADLARPYPGAIQLLKDLRNKGYKVGVLTRGCREYAEHILSMCGVLELLDGLVCRDDFPEKEAKPSPMAMIHLGESLGVEASEIIYVGDHDFDYRTAISSGAGFIGVLSGGYDEDDWRSISNDVCTVRTVAEIRDMI